ncbi:hypothetical protein L6R29_10910 [Myxococcota bacterium]|nr:hypothetical protein [Myxococcota bacterium]
MSHPSRCLWFLLAAFLGLTARVQASTNCFQWSAKGEDLKAARCFQRAADRIPASAQDPFQRSIRGNHLRNSALAYYRAAQKEKDQAVRAYRKERAVRALRRFLSERLCSGEGHCAQVRQRMEQIAQSILYKKLEVAAPQGVRTRVVIQGYRFREVHYTPWVGRVRPGPYTLLYQSAKQKTRRHALAVEEEQKADAPPLRVVLPIPADEASEMQREQRTARTPRKKPRTRRTRLAALPSDGASAPKEPTPKEPTPKEPEARDVSQPIEPPKRTEPEPPKRTEPEPPKRTEPEPPPRRGDPPTTQAVVKPPKKREEKKIAMARKQPPKKPNPPPSVVGPAILMGIGGAALIGGGIAMGLGYGQISDVGQTIEALRKDADQRTPEEQILATKSGLSAAQLQQRLGNLETQVVVGWIVVGAAAAIGGAGLIWYLVQRATYKPDPPAPPPIPAPNARLLFDSHSFSSSLSTRSAP